MATHPHVILKNEVLDIISYKGRGFPSGNPLPVSDPQAHVLQLKDAYKKSLQSSLDEGQRVLPTDVPPAAGNYVNISVDEGSSSATWNQLDSNAEHHIMNTQVSDDGICKYATIYLPQNKESWLDKKLSKYIAPPKGNRRSFANLIDAIHDIKPVSLSSFFSKNEDVLENETAYELWLPIEENVDESEYVKTVKVVLERLGVSVGNGVVAFEGMIVLLVTATRLQLEQLIHAVKPIAEIRRYYHSAVLTKALKEVDQEWTQLIETSVPRAPGNLTRVGILDSGVNNGHPLISQYLSDDRCEKVKDCPLKDFVNHGTPMAGVVLYGDMAVLIGERKIQPVTNELVSVKMFHDATSSEHDDEHRALVTKNAIDKSCSLKANVMVSSVTSAEECLSGTPSATSAAIDKRIFNEGKSDCLLMLSAGNKNDDQGVEYPNFLTQCGIHDPAQAWNALTVGAMTEKVAVQDPNMKNVRIVAAKGGPSPTTTSAIWNDCNVIKPEIVMEGGNAYWETDHSFAYHDDLDLVSTNAKYAFGHSFTYFNATSAAVSMAAHLAGEIQYNNPNLSPLSIRALMVHSAEWTEEMIDLYSVGGVLDKMELMKVCGYGTPNRDKAIASSNSYVTFIHETTLRPFVKKDGGLSLGRMHLYKLPWPKDVLLSMGEKRVKLKVTLSYYVEPSPGKREVLDKYRYASIGLRFDVNRPTESESEFRARMSNLENVDEEQSNKSSKSLAWKIGYRKRNYGSIHSDFIESSAVDIAACNYIAVTPVTGWWKTRRKKLNSEIKYSLVVSLETPETDIYTAIQQQINIPVPT